MISPPVCFHGVSHLVPPFRFLLHQPSRVLQLTLSVFRSPFFCIAFPWTRRDTSGLGPPEVDFYRWIFMHPHFSPPLLSLRSFPRDYTEQAERPPFSTSPYPLFEVFSLSGDGGRAMVSQDPRRGPARILGVDS